MTLIQKIDNYSNWILTECDAPHEEITWLINTIIENEEENESVRELYETLDEIKNKTLQNERSNKTR